ncbi:glycoside hydrolase family 19 protein [Ekhidna sp.]
MNPLETFQKKIGTSPDGDFGPMTFRKGREYLNISDIEAVHFFAQCSHETAGFKVFKENLNYSADGLLKVFGKYFNEGNVTEYARNPEKIANRVYANRMGNGDEQSGDGWKYKGRGAIQLTGKNNYEKLAENQNVDFISNPDLVETDYAFESAIHFFNVNNLFSICTDLTEETIKKLTKRINGGYNGLDHRIELTNKYSNYT